MAKPGTSKIKVKRLVSAGGAVYRIRDGVIETVLCGRSDPLMWGLPKGTPEVGESMEETALREVREETGLKVEIEVPIGSVNYWFVSPEDRARCYKTVHFYLMSAKGGDISQHDHEFDIVQWFSIDEALKTATYPTELGILERVRSIVSDRMQRGDGASHGS